MKYSYEIVTVVKSEKWIFIKHENWNALEGFINLLKRISYFYHGELFKLAMISIKSKTINST